MAFARRSPALGLGASLIALLLPRAALAAPTVWAIDDGEKIKEDAPPGPLAAGEGNPVWSPGSPLRIFALKNETVAFQIVVAADDAALSGVTVDLDALANGDAKIANAPGAVDPTLYVGRPVERFVEHFFDVKRASGGTTAGVSLGWEKGAAPAAGAWSGRVPDALIPVEIAPSWSPYPMNVAPGKNGVVWIDVTVPKSQAPGLYKGNVLVKSGETELASIAVELDVVDAELPDRPVQTMLCYARDELDRRIGGGDAAEKQLFRLYHRHRLVPMHTANSAADVTRQIEALDGSLFTAAAGYEGPGEGQGDGLVSLGTYGAFGAPDASKLATVEAIADALAAKGVLEKTDAFVYAIDEECSSPYGAEWKSLLEGSANPNAKKIKVAWTCSADPSKQPVDIPMLLADFDPALAAKARAMGKDVWTYNGMMPRTGAFFTDTAAISTRVNGWLSGMFDIGRWFYWETTAWYDENQGGLGAFDPFATAETFHNKYGDWAVGDGVLVYPGKQIDGFTTHSLGMDGVVASIRLKNWRRGIEDAGYYQLARAADAAAADAIAKGLIPSALSSASGGKPSWSESGKPWFDARKALLALVPKGPGAPGDPNAPGANGAVNDDDDGEDGGCGCRAAGSGNDAALFVLGLAAFLAVSRRRTARRYAS